MKIKINKNLILESFKDNFYDAAILNRDPNYYRIDKRIKRSFNNLIDDIAARKYKEDQNRIKLKESREVRNSVNPWNSGNPSGSSHTQNQMKLNQHFQPSKLPKSPQKEREITRRVEIYA